MPSARITFNTLDWSNPSGKSGKCPGKLWEKQAGFGFEEWYRNKSFQKEEEGEIWQYGYLQCFKEFNNHKGMTYFDVDFFTRQCNGYKSNWILAAKYRSIYVLNDKERMAAVQYFSNELLSIRTELIRMGIDVASYYDNQPDNYPQLNFKFMIKEENYLFNIQSPINYVPKNNSWRYRNFYY